MTSIQIFILAYVIGAIIFSIIVTKSAYHIIKPNEIAFHTKHGVYQRYYDIPSVVIVAPFISKVIRLDYTKVEWREQLQQIAIKLDIDQKEINELKEKIEESRRKIV